MHSKHVICFLSVAAAFFALSDTTVETGTEMIDGNGENVDLGVVTVGTKNVEASPTLVLTNGVFTSNGNLYLQKGNGSKEAPQVSTLRVASGAELTVANLYTGQNNGNNSHYSSSRLEIDGGKMTVGTARTNNSLNNGMAYHSANKGNAVIEVKNGGEFYDDAVYYTQTGMKMGNGYNVDSTPRLEVTSGSTAGMHGLLLRQGATVTVDHATFQLNRTMDQLYATEAMGDAFFNDATLTYYSNLLKFNCNNFANQVVEWFHGARVHVGADGLNLAIPGHARLEGMLLPAAGAENSARVSVAGSGTFQTDVFGTSVPIAPGANVTLKSTRKTPSWTDSLGNVTFDQTAGKPFAFAGHGALAQGTLHPTASGLVGRLEATAGNFVRDQWVIRDWAQIYDDGVAMMGQIGGYHAAAAWLKEKVDVTRSFTLSFVYSAANVRNSGNSSSGLMAVWQNSSTGTSTIGGNHEGNNGYFGSDNAFENSFAVGVQANGVYAFGKNHEQLGDKPSAGFTAAQLGATPGGRLYVTVRYDAVANTMTISSYLASAKTRTTAARSEVNLQEITGDSKAWFGFTGNSNFTNDGQQFVEGVSLVYDEEPERRCMPHLGGALALDAGTDYTIAVRGNSIQRGGVIGTLAYGDGSKITIENEGIEENMSDAIPSPDDLPTSDDASDWSFAGGAKMLSGDRTGIALSAKNAEGGAGGIASNLALPVTGDWTIGFDLNYDTSSAGANMASYIYFAFSLDDVTYTAHNYTKYLAFVLNPSYVANETEESKSSVSWFCRFNNANQGTVSGSLFNNVSLFSGTPIHVGMTYEASSHYLTVTLSQDDGGVAKRDVAVINIGNNLSVANYPDGTSRFMAKHNGYEDNRPRVWIDNFSYSSPLVNAKDAVEDVAVGFDTLVPATEGATIEKLGGGALVISEPGSSAASVKLSEGSLVLRKTPIEKVYADYDHGGWTFSDDTGTWGAHRGLKLNSSAAGNANNAVTVNRVAVSGDWRASFKINLEGQSTPADAVCFFIQNAPGGSHQLGNNNAYATWTGKNGVAVGWTVYPSANNYSRVDFANCRAFNFNSADQYFGDKLNLPNATTDVTLEYDSKDHTLSMRMAQGESIYEKTWENIDIKTAVGGDFAYLGFGTGGGGAHAYPEFVDFRFEQMSSDDPTEDMLWIGGVELTEEVGTLELDTPLEGSKVRVGSVAVPAGVVFSPTSVNARGVLDVDVLDAGSGEEVAIDTAGADVRIRSVASGVAKLVVSGGGKIILPAGDSLADCAIQLADDETSIYIEGRVKVLSVSVGDELQRNGRYSPGDAAWIAGAVGSVLKTELPVLGLTVIVR